MKLCQQKERRRWFQVEENRCNSGTAEVYVTPDHSVQHLTLLHGGGEVAGE